MQLLSMRMPPFSQLSTICGVQYSTICCCCCCSLDAADAAADQL
jgi:hypothetical protein